MSTIPVNDAVGTESTNVQLKSMKILNDSTSSNMQCEGKREPEYTIYWNNLTYIVYRASVDKFIGKLRKESPVPPNTRTILNAVCGSFQSGAMTVLMGPSGAGKTTLLECLIGKRQRGLSGEIKIKLTDTSTKINLALVPQTGDFFENLTVYETIKYSSQLKNSKLLAFDHDGVTVGIIKKLDLNRVKGSIITSLSGSERKRLAIGIEIVSKPNLLVLDEPTTGLDSYAAQKVINFLYEISREGVGVIMTIHQPSWNIFKLFDKVYMLSPVVQSCIYEGPPKSVMPYLSARRLTAKVGVTPPDFITNVASGFEGDKPKELLLSMVSDAGRSFTDQGFNDSDISLLGALSKCDQDIVSSFRTLLFREIKVHSRDVSKFLAQFITTISISLIMLFGLGGHVDNYIGCPAAMSDIPDKFDTMQFYKHIENLNFEIIWMSYIRRFVYLVALTSSFVGLYLPLFFTQMDMKVVWREVKNGSYSSNVYIMARTIVEMTNLFILIGITAAIAYALLGGNYDDAWRPVAYVLAMYLAANNTHAISQTIAVLLRNSPVSTSLFIGEFVNVPNILFCGLLVRSDRSLEITSLIDWIVTFKYPYDIAQLSYSSYDACGRDIRDRVIKIRRSVAAWIFDYMALVDGHQESVIGNNMYQSVIDGKMSSFSSDTSSNISSIVDGINMFAEGIADGATTYFIGWDGEVRPAHMCYQYDNIDSDLGRMATVGIMQIILYRMIAHFMMTRAMHEKW